MNKAPLTVSQVTSYLKVVMDEDENLKSIFIRGEISNFKLHSSGHIYFTLKDENSKIRCVMFRNYANQLKFKPEDGMKVIIDGNISIYEKDGQYQAYCFNIQQDGIGSLYIKFEQLKKQLLSEGLFDSSKKKSLPFLPQKVGVITSPTGAVIRDIINVSKHRFLGTKIIIYPAKVQGQDAAKTIINGIEYFNSRNDIDVIIIARGGGSIEELWAFNEESVVRAVASSKIPLVSAIGHETDFTLCDFAADVRASTPSHAAEIVVPSYEDIKYMLKSTQRQIEERLKDKINKNNYGYKQITNRLIVESPHNLINQHFQNVDNIQDKLIYSINTIVKDYSGIFSVLIHKMDTLNPMKVLNRGYSIIEKNDKVVDSIKSIENNDVIKMVFKDGQVYFKVSNILEGELWQEKRKI